MKTKGLRDRVLGPAVIRLLGARRPTKIPWLVVAVVFYSINGEPSWAGSEITENPISECGIVVDPWLVHRDSPATIARVVIFVWVEAASLDARPELIEPFTASAVGRHRVHKAFPGSLSIQTTATFCVTRAKTVRYYNKLLTTVTSTDSLRSLVFPFLRRPNSDESPESLATEVERPTSTDVSLVAAAASSVSISKTARPDDNTAPTIAPADPEAALPRRKPNGGETAKLFTCNVQFPHAYIITHATQAMET